MRQNTAYDVTIANFLDSHRRALFPEQNATIYYRTEFRKTSAHKKTKYFFNN